MAETHDKRTETHACDLISRQAALDALGERPVVWTDKIYYILGARNQYDMDRLAIETVPSAQQWIPVSERLPDEETDVLVTRRFLGCKDGSHGWNNHIPPKTYVEVAQYFDGEWTALSDEYKVARSRHTDPVAWMPLPEPWKGEKNG